MEREELILGIQADIEQAKANLETLQGQLDELQRDWDLPALEAEVSADVENAEQVVADLESELQDALELPVTVTGTDEAVSQVGEVAEAGRGIGTAADEGSQNFGTAIGNVISSAGNAKGALDAAERVTSALGESLDDAGGKAGILGVALTALGAIISIGVGLWERFSNRQSDAARTTDEITESINDNVGALGRMREALDDIIESGDFTGLDALNQALLDVDPEQFQANADAVTALGGSYRDVAGVLAEIQAGNIRDVLIDAGIPPELVATAEAIVESGGAYIQFADRYNPLAQEQLANSNALRESYDAQLQAVVQLSQGQVDLNEIAQTQIDAIPALGESADLLAKARESAGLDASAVDVWSEYIELQNEAAAAAEEFARQQEEAAAGAESLATAMQSIDWRQSELEGATNAMSEFTRQQFSATNQIQAEQEAFDQFEAAIEGVGITFDLTTEAGQRQNDALEGIAAVIDTRLANAYDLANGNATDFANQATAISEEILGRLQDQLNLTDEEVEAVATALGLLPEDIETRFEMAGVAEAQLQLGLLQGAIEGLPPEVESNVNLLILQGDYVGARDAIVQYYADNPVPAPVEPTFDTTKQLGVEPFKVPAEVDLDTDDAQGKVDEFVEPRTTDVDLVAHTETAVADIDTATELRILDVYLGLVNGSEFDTVIDNHTAPRPLDVHIQTGSVDLPSNGELARRIGTIRVPIQAYWNHRIEGSRPRP